MRSGQLTLVVIAAAAAVACLLRPGCRTEATQVGSGTLVVARAGNDAASLGGDPTRSPSPADTSAGIRLPAGSAAIAARPGPGDAGEQPVVAPASLRAVRVVDLRGSAVAAEVLVYGATGTDEPLHVLRTDAEGRARAAVEAGARLVALTPDGRHGGREVPTGEDEIGIRVFDAVALRGRVLDLDSQAPLVGARVRAERLDMPRGLSERLGAHGVRERVAETDATGTFELAPFHPGSYRIEFSAEGHDTYVDAREWYPTDDWDMGAVQLEAMGELRVRLIGFDPSARPALSFGRLGERVVVDTEGSAVVRVPRSSGLQHFSIWLASGSMMNVYREGTLEEVRDVVVHVGGRRTLEVHVEGEVGSEVAAMGEPSIRVRFVPAPGLRAEWNRDVAAGPPFVTDCIDADEASVDLVALSDGWPNVLTTTTVALAPTGVNEVTLRMPTAVRRLALRTVDGAPLARDVFVELRRAHDPTRWLASAYPDAEGRVPWPDVDTAELYCGGVFTWEPPESFFIDLRLPNATGVEPTAPLALGPSRSHRVRVVVDGEGWGGARMGVVGRHTDQPWTYFRTGADGWTEAFLVTEGSEVDYVVDDARLVGSPLRVHSAGEETVVTGTTR